MKKRPDTERAERRLAFVARLLLLADPKLDCLLVPIYERRECSLRMLRTRDRLLAEWVDSGAIKESALAEGW
jgi:hypothetical protein